MTFRTRFAPSPTGFLHLGNARTALFCYLAARTKGGEMLLRIEDSDRARNTLDGAAAIAEDLQWLGCKWRQVPPQSARLDDYEKQMQKLQDGNMAYPCFCSPEELDRQRQQCAAAKKPPRYLGKCNNLTAAQARQNSDGGICGLAPSFAIVVRELCAGSCVGGDIGDFIIRRANGDFSFIFINAVENAADGIIAFCKRRSFAACGAPNPILNAFFRRRNKLCSFPLTT